MFSTESPCHSPVNTCPSTTICLCMNPMTNLERQPRHRKFPRNNCVSCATLAIRAVPPYVRSVRTRPADAGPMRLRAGHGRAHRSKWVGTSTNPWGRRLLALASALPQSGRSVHALCSLPEQTVGSRLWKACDGVAHVGRLGPTRLPIVMRVTVSLFGGSVTCATCSL
jgi:hypothetical protein